MSPDRPDVARRNLARWIGGYNEPSRISRIAVARALDLPDDTFLDEDDEEADPVTRIRRIRAELVLLDRDDLADQLRALIPGGDR